MKKLLLIPLFLLGIYLVPLISIPTIADAVFTPYTTLIISNENPQAYYLAAIDGRKVADISPSSTTQIQVQKNEWVTIPGQTAKQIALQIKSTNNSPLINISISRVATTSLLGITRPGSESIFKTLTSKESNEHTALEAIITLKGLDLENTTAEFNAYSIKG